MTFDADMDHDVFVERLDQDREDAERALHRDERRARADLFPRRPDSQVTPLGGVSGRPERPCSAPPQDGAPAQAVDGTNKNAPAPLVPAGG